MSFAHLHLHTTYSLLDGFSDIKKLMKRVQEMGMPAVAITDHGTMFGVIEFYNAAKANGIKPIIGVEAYLAARKMTDRDAKLDKHSSHLLLLAENNIGYRNLLEIASASQLKGFYYYPRIDRDFLAEHSDGLIATTGCMAAETPRAIMNEGIEAARSKLDWYFDVFGKDRFFFELQQHNIKELPGINRALMELGPRYQARYIATNDVHYINPSDARLQDILLSIQTGSVLTDPNRFRMSDQSYYLRSAQEMATLFADVPEALSNTLLIADRCNVDLTTQGYHLPLFPVPEGLTAERFLHELCEEGLQRRYGPHASELGVRERLEYELGIIHQMGFDTYFLIVWDLCRHAREVGIWYNARGSGGASMVAYCLDITLVEPVSMDLIFERFLNPARISMPDIDMDFEDDKRAQMMAYTAQKYGHDKVAQIITFGTMGARGALRDVARVMEIPLAEVDRVTKLVPNIPGKPVTLVEAIQDNAELQAAYADEERPFIKDLIDTAGGMEGTVRSAGTHAAGVVITDKPVGEYVPLHRPTSGAEDSPIKTVTQFEMSIIESLGLLKVDFLGLATLTTMQRACKLIKERQGVDYNLNNIPFDDLETFRFISGGHTAGVFQLEGTGMTRFITQMKPKSLDHVIAMVALYRPGPLEFIPTYIKRMHGEEAVTYRHPALEPIFKGTFGIPIYQEQIMRAAVELGGYTLSESYELCKVIAKKQKEKLEKHRAKFIKGCMAKSIPQEVAGEIFSDWEEFARYGFNKAHAADYGVIAVQTAYLKAHYTVEYMTALLSASKNETAKVAEYIADCRSMGIDVLPPDLNTSAWDFSIEDRPDQKPAIRFGLGAIKNVGGSAVALIQAARQEKGRFTDLSNLAQRVDLRQVGRRSLECMIKVGAFDNFGPRLAVLEVLDRLVAVSTSHFRAAQSGQLSLFGGGAVVMEEIALPGNVHGDRREVLNWERELLGLYVSDHPLSPYLAILQRKVTHFSSQLSEVKNRQAVIVAGMITRIRPHQAKNGKPMGFVTLEDLQGLVEVVVFPRTWEKYGSLIEFDKVIAIEGKVDASSGDPKVLADRIVPVNLEDQSASEAPAAQNQPVDLRTIPSAWTIDEPPETGPENFDIYPSGDYYTSDRPGGQVEADSSPDDSFAGSSSAAGAPSDCQTASFAAGSHMIEEPTPATSSPLPAMLGGISPAAQTAPAPQAAVVLAAQADVSQTAPTYPAADDPEDADLPEPPPSFFEDGAWLPASPAGNSSSAQRPIPARSELVRQTVEKPAPKASAAHHSTPTQADVPLEILPSPEKEYTASQADAQISSSAPLAGIAVLNEAAYPAIAPSVSVHALPNYIIAPAAPKGGELEEISENTRRMVTVTMRSTGEKTRDVRRLRRIHGLLSSTPGQDRFAFQTFENNHFFMLEFPNESTGLSSDLLSRLIDLAGEGNVRVEIIPIQ